MIFDKSVLAIIPARGGSKGVPRKNLRPLGDRPLIAWSIAAAKQSRYIDKVLVTSDDAEILEAARRWGCGAMIRRPAELASDEAPLEGALIHALDHADASYDYIVLLQPTSPFRTPGDIDETISLCLSAKASACLSICEPSKSPYWMCNRTQDGHLKPILVLETPATRRQDLPRAYALNGAVYVADIPWFRSNRTFYNDETIGYVMPQDRSLDIDTEFDFALADALVSAGVFLPSGLEKS